MTGSSPRLYAGPRAANARMRFMSASTAQRTVQLRPYGPPPDNAVQLLEVEVTRTVGETLELRYSLHAHLSRLRIPEPKPTKRTDELWRHTCFEAFLRAAEGTGYREINVAPSTEWAMYSFDDYRKGMTPQNVPQPPAIHVERAADRLIVAVQIDLKVLPPSRALALATVIEHEGGSLSYWALKHPAAKPDFHHPEGFALEI